MRAMSDEELEARLKEICLSTPGRGLEDALRCGKAARARREWAGLARLAAAAVVAWLLSAAAGAAVDRSIATIQQAPGGTVVAERGRGKLSPRGALAVVWQRRRIEEMAFEDWAPDWRLEYGGPRKRARDDRQGFFWGKPFEKGYPPGPLPKLSRAAFERRLV